MIAKTFDKQAGAWGRAVESLSQRYARVIAPVKDGDKPYYHFAAIQPGDEPNFEVLKTRLSPKGAVFPQSERMFDYSLEPEDDRAHILEETPKDFSEQVVVGIRPCDAAAFKLAQVNFDTVEYKDPWWTQRYASTTLIGVGCLEPAPSCFCTSVGCAPFGEGGLDALVYDLGERYLVRALTEKGDRAVAAMDGGAEVGDGDEVIARAAELAAQARRKVPGPVATEHLASRDVVGLFEADFWADEAAGCINCGTCTFGCPTCWCFDIQDETYRLDGKRHGDRIRNWDSCMFELFTRHGMGHNPRGGKHQRVRQRFMHKLKYYVDKYKDHPDVGGKVLCVGCGRCVDSCPTNIDIRRIAALMNAFEPQEVKAASEPEKVESGEHGEGKR